MNSTFSDKAVLEELTFEKIKEAARLIEKLPRKPFIVFSWVVPYDQAYYGPAVDIIIKAHYPWFNPEHDKGYLLNKRYEGEMDILLKDAQLTSLLEGQLNG